jgi:peptidoglycan/LPS O-acetylase OafA/YrhL
VCAIGVFSWEPEKVVTPVVWAAVLVGERWPQLGAALLSKIMVYARLRRGNPSCGFLNWRFVQWLGAISYPLYLVNVPVQIGCAMIVAPLARGDERVFALAWVPLAVLMPVAAAAVVHRLVEVRGMGRKKAGDAAGGPAAPSAA